MLSRRTILLGGGVAVAAAGAGYFAISGDDMGAYDAAAATVRAPLPASPDQRELVRYATLAANSHNTQPWRFRLSDRQIDILPDLSRRTPVVDPDDHHLFTSLGCASENLVIAAAARGQRATPRFEQGADGSVAIALEPAPAVETPAFQAIPVRQSTRSVYDGRPVPAADLASLQATAQNDLVDVLLVTERARIDAVMALVVEGNTAQLTDPAFVAELKSWIRFDRAEAIRKSDGLYAGASGNPNIPPWLGRLIFGFVATPKAENAKAVEQIRSSPALAIFVGKTADRPHWVEVGRSYQRFALAATALGLKQAFVNQAVEVPEVRAKLAIELGIAGRRPDLVIRLGTGPDMPKSLRRPTSAVIV